MRRAEVKSSQRGEKEPNKIYKAAQTGKEEKRIGKWGESREMRSYKAQEEKKKQNSQKEIKCENKETYI